MPVPNPSAAAGSLRLNPNPQWPFWVAPAIPAPVAPGTGTTPVDSGTGGAMVIEMPAAVQQTTVTLLDETADLAQQGLYSLDEAAGITVSAAYPLEQPAGVAAAGVASVDEPAGVAASGVLPIEEIASVVAVSQTAVLPLEAIQQLAPVTAGLPSEDLMPVSSEQLVRNMVSNGGFEASFNNWTIQDTNASVAFGRDSTTSAFGTWSEKLVNANAGEDDFALSNTMQVMPGATYTLSVYVNVTAFTAAAVLNRGVCLVTGKDSVPQNVFSANITAVTAGWVRMTVTRTMGATENTAWVRLYAPQATVYYDAVQLEFGPTANTYVDTSTGPVSQTLVTYPQPLDEPTGVTGTAVLPIAETGGVSTPAVEALDETQTLVGQQASVPVEEPAGVPPQLQIVPVEEPAGASSLTVELLDSPGGIAAPSVLPINSPGGVTAASVPPIEETSGVPAQTAAVPIEEPQGISGQAPVLLDATGGVTTGGVFLLDAPGTVQALALLALDEPAGVAATTVSPVEETGAVAAALAVLRIEATGGITSTGVYPIETTGLISVTATGLYPIEARQQIVAAPVAPVESIQALAPTAPAPIEQPGGVTASTVTPIEITQAVAQTLQVPIETAADITASALANAETLMGVTSELTVTNVLSNGGFETNTSGWSTNNGGTTISRDATVSFVGSASLKVVMDGTLTTQGVLVFSGGGKAFLGQTFTGQVRVLAPTGASYAFELDFRDTTGGLLSSATIGFTGTGAWRLVTVTGTATNAATARVGVKVRQSGASGRAETTWIDAAQVEIGSVANNYVDTSTGPVSQTFVTNPQPIESPQGISATALASLDAPKQLTAVPVLPLDETQTLTQARVSPLDLAQALTATGLSPVEAVLALLANAVVPFDAAAAVLQLAAMPITQTANVTSSGLYAVEQTTTIFTSAAVPAETTAGVANPALAPFDAPQALLAAQTGVLDATQVVAAVTGPFPLDELAAAVSQASALAVETPRGISAATGLSLDTVQQLLQLAGVPLEATFQTALVLTSATATVGRNPHADAILLIVRPVATLAAAAKPVGYLIELVRSSPRADSTQPAEPRSTIRRV